MVTNIRRWSLGIAVAGLLLSALPVSANDTEGVVRLGDHNNQASGVIRISDKLRQVKNVFRGQSPCDDTCVPAASYPASLAPPSAVQEPVQQGKQIDTSIPPVPSDPGQYNPPAEEAPMTEPAKDAAADGVEGVSYEDCVDEGCASIHMGNYGSYDAGNNQGYTYADCPNCRRGRPCRRCRGHYASSPFSLGNACSKFGSSRLGQFWAGQAAMYRARNRYSSMILEDALEAECQSKHEWLRCKFGYFIPTGCGGAGCPPMGHYNMVYPVDPNHFDQRDGQVYAAQGYGGPVSVPLAPNVNHTYNYGWGVPSSRLTPVSRPAH